MLPPKLCGLLSMKNNRILPAMVVLLVAGTVFAISLRVQRKQSTQNSDRVKLEYSNPGFEIGN